jgi:hypothetical protein
MLARSAVSAVLVAASNVAEFMQAGGIVQRRLNFRQMDFDWAFAHSHGESFLSIVNPVDMWSKTRSRR